MRNRLLLAGVFVILGTLSALADARMSVLVDVLKLPEAAVILTDEGKAQAQDLNTDMLDGRGGPGWAMQVDHIYAPTLMVEMVRAELENELSGAALEEVIAFFASDLGTRIVDLENSARITIQDPQAEEAARARFIALEDTGDARLGLIDAYIDSGDMVTRNVTTALNTNVQFLRGLVDGNAIEMTEEEILTDAARDLEAVTRDTTEWLFGYMLLAYHPLSDDELRSYLAFSETDAGQALNRALFAGFAKAYEDISYALGRAVALNMMAQDL